ncbi:MAG: hypothetical protein AB7N99_08965 [Simkaniaceae bacterium]
MALPAISYDFLYTSLNRYLTSELPSCKQEEFAAVMGEFGQLSSRVTLLVQKGEVTPELIDTLPKLEALRAKVFSITQANVASWKEKILQESYDAETVESVCQQVIQEYAQRWGIQNSGS